MGGFAACAGRRTCSSQTANRELAQWGQAVDLRHHDPWARQQATQPTHDLSTCTNHHTNERSNHEQAGMFRTVTGLYRPAL
jgi:hypothetical protein